ncbi:hypothetical protein B4113_2569 [Geobacillus sp. B4113_201601]|nr:hypothetical protein B4113_2569 [Geobacillus sp. B4113_201601]
MVTKLFHQGSYLEDSQPFGLSFPLIANIKRLLHGNGRLF